MNYCFLARPCLDVFAPKMFLDIKARYDRNAVGVFVVMNEREGRNVKKIVQEGVVCNISSFIKEHWAEFSLKELGEYEKKYDCAPIWKYIYTDRFLIERDYDYTVKISVGLFAFFENIFNKYRIDIYYSETIATLLCYAAYLVGKKTGTKYYSQTGARGLDASHHFLMDEPFENVKNFNCDYCNIDYNDQELKVAEKFLSNFENKEVIPSYMTWKGKQEPKFQYKYLVLPFVRFLKRFSPTYSDPYSYIYYKSYKHCTDPLKFYIRYNYCKRYYKRADYSRKYVYFPLHYQPEASTIVCAQKYEKQLFFIDSWAKSLPADTVLYVKEHYAVLGNREVVFFEELKKYPNVFVISPWENSRNLIINSVAVTTLTGTAGWEAFLLHKPVFLGGDIFFSNAPGVIKVDDIYGNYLDAISSWKQPSRDLVLKYICEYFRCIKPGIQNGYGPDKSDTDENIHLLVDSLMSEEK